jgi:cyclopropane-fatty-acyl-phospholipid synthase
MNNTLTLPGIDSTPRDTHLVLDMLSRITHGTLDVHMPDGTRRLFGHGDHAIALEVRNEAMFSRVLARGDIGLAEAYLEGEWDCVDITGLLRLLAHNREPLRSAVYGRWRHLFAARIRHLLNGNTRLGSKRNITAHYDLGNAFYARWLDPGMSYSSALFDGDESRNLEGAQQAKYCRVLDRLQATPGQSVLEIGCGWGGFAALATQASLKVTGVTLSPSQLELAQQKAPEADLRLQDYRDLRERFDHVVSIEMFEAVGERWWPTYFKTVARSLKPGGRAVVQTITIEDSLFAEYRKGTDFIQQYIFPGGMLPSRSAFRAAALKQGLVVSDEFGFGGDYARTLREWRIAFEHNWPQIAELGFDEKFRRLWRLYLCYCEAGFLAGNINVVQFELCHN